MPVLRDYTVITGADGAYDAEFALGAGNDPDIESRTLRFSFNTGGRRGSGGALLMFSVRGLTRTEGNPEVRINGQRIGEIARYTPGSNPEFPANSRYWFNQTIAFDAGLLDAGDGLANTLEFRTVATQYPGQEGSREDFTLKSIVCFFPQRSDSGQSWVEDALDGVASAVTWVVGGLGTVVTFVVNVITTVVNVLIEILDSTVGWIVAVLGFIVELSFAIPILGRLLKWIWNAGLTGFWFVAPLGLLDFLGSLVGVLPEKKMRVCTIILRDELGDPVDTRENLVPQLQNVVDIYKREANIRVIPSAPFQFDSAFGDPEVATEDWVHVQGRGSNNPDVLDVPCDGGILTRDLGTAGGQFELIASTECFYSNGRRVIGYGAPIIVFIVRSVGSGGGCSLGPLTDYVVVERGRGPDSGTIAHEIGHACNLLHADDPSNLMNPDRSGNQLTRFQVAMVRASRHVSFS